MSDSSTLCSFDFDLTPISLNDNCYPEISPLKDLSEVIQFHNNMSNGEKSPWLDKVIEIQPATDFCYYSFDDANEEGWFPKPRIDRNSVPKTLFCHDYKGGYLEDRFVFGSFKNNSYNFFNWTCVDIFVYFSHHFVTIPPPGWINAAHTHGVPILGTLITEGNKGHLVWEQILESEEKAIWFSEVLALISDTHKFDGYLLNIENNLSVNLMPRLMIFIKSLKQNLIKYKKFKTFVIWYDSITVYGELKWQNELNYNNKPFFDITDGIFLNYSWKELNLDHSKKMAAERIHNVFVGVDVFGRNMYGGGGYDTKVALDIIRKKNLSAAIFAFGWTEEKLPGNFMINDDIFWLSISPYFYTHGTKQLPFKSNFSKGCGLKYYQKGVIVVDRPWFNLSKQSYQYSYLRCKTQINKELINNIIFIIKEYIFVLNEKKKKENEEQKADLAKAQKMVDLVSQLNILYGRMKSSVIEYTFSDAYNGGGCIRVTPSMQEGMKHVSLFDADIEIKNEWFVKTVMKSENEKHLSDIELYPVVYIVIENKEGVLTKMELRHGEIESSEAEWVIRKFLLTQKGRILEIGLLVNPTHRPVLFGEILISDSLNIQENGALISKSQDLSKKF